MTRRIALIQAHPDAAGGHLCHALAQAYADGAARAGHEVRVIDVAHLDFPLLRSRKTGSKARCRTRSGRPRTPSAGPSTW